ncbi:hypothetical protein ANCCAN_12486, partial [Ancylostoma caninum]
LDFLQQQVSRAIPCRRTTCHRLSSPQRHNGRSQILSPPYKRGHGHLVKLSPPLRLGSLRKMKTPSESETQSTNGLKSNKACAAVRRLGSKAPTSKHSSASQTRDFYLFVTDVLNLSTFPATELFILISLTSRSDGMNYWVKLADFVSQLVRKRNKWSDTYIVTEW